MTAALLTLREVATLTGVSYRHARRIARQLGAVRHQGKRMVPVANLPEDAQRRALQLSRRHGLAVVTAGAIRPGATATGAGAPKRTALLSPEDAAREAAGQLPLAVSPLTPTGGLADARDEAHAEAARRYAIVAALVKPDEYRALWRHCGDTATGVVAFLHEQHRIPERTLWRWVHLAREAGMPGLVQRHRRDRGTPRALTAEAIAFLWAALKADGAARRSGAEIHRAYEEERVWRAKHPDPAKPALPKLSYRTLDRWWAKVPRMAKTLALDGVDAFANREEILSHRDLGAVEPLEWVVMDHRMLDIHALAPLPRGGFRLVRPWVTAAIDMRTRRWLAWAIVEQPSSDSIATVLKRVCLAHGIPAHAYWDNGKDFRCHYLEGRTERVGERRRAVALDQRFAGVCDRLGIRVTHAIPLRARSKLIEPNFGRLAKYDATLPWYCGNAPDARPAAFDAMVAQHERWLREEADATPFPFLDEIPAVYDAAFAALNERPLEGEGMRKATPTGYGWCAPEEAWRKLTATLEIRRAPAEVIHFAFLRRKELRVEHGEVACTFGARKVRYHLAEQPIALMPLNGERVELAYDPLDLGTAALYHGERFVGLVENVELRRMGAEGFERDEKMRRGARRAVREMLARLGECGAEFPAQAVRVARRAEIAGRPQLPPPALEMRPFAIDEPRALTSSGAAATEATARPTNGCVERAAPDPERAGRPRSQGAEYDFWGEDKAREEGA